MMGSYILNSGYAILKLNWDVRRDQVINQIVLDGSYWDVLWGMLLCVRMGNVQMGNVGEMRDAGRM